MAGKLSAIACVTLLTGTQASNEQVAVNPIRKVVSLLQMMQKKVTEEGAKEKELYDKYMCYCKNGAGELQSSISGAETKIPQVGSDIKQAESDKARTEEDLKGARADLAAAKAAMREAKAIREKEATAFAAEKAEADSNLFAILGKCSKQKPGGEYTAAECSKLGGKFVGAIPAIEQGMAGAFLQTEGAAVLKSLIAKQDIDDADKNDVLAFLSGSSQYAPQSGQILGILKQMADSMNANLAAATADENAAIKAFTELMDAKTKESNALQAGIESKIKKIGDLAVSIVQMKNDLSETEAALLEDQKFLADLDKNCATKTSEWEERSKTRSEELLALADTIKLLNDDDALDLFKKTLPSGASFAQMQTSSDSLRAKALSLVRAEMQKPSRDRSRLELVALALSGKKMAAGGFEKVVKMIDDMVKLLKEEQTADDDKKEYCLTQFDNTDDKQKALERKLSQVKTAISTTEDGIATLKDEIAALTADIKALDKDVAEATAQRQAENNAFQEMIASDSAAKELLGIAKNRLNKFYNPKLFKPAPKVELSAQERILVSQGGTASPTPAPGGIANTGVTYAQVSLHSQSNSEVAPPPPPATWDAYAKKSGESTGVIGMIDLLVKDLTKEMTEGKTAEADSQADYEQMMRDSAEKRMTDTQSLADKTAARAGLEQDLAAHNDEKRATSGELAATLEYIASLHSECDWLLKYFDVRKEARSGEVDSLVNAKAVLNGADYSLLQSKSGNLRRIQQ